MKEQQDKLSYARKLCNQNGVKINGTCKVFVIKKNEKVTEADLEKLLTKSNDVYRNFVSHSENEQNTSPSLFKKLMGEFYCLRILFCYNSRKVVEQPIVNLSKTVLVAVTVTPLIPTDLCN